MHSPVFVDLIPSFECVLQEIRNLHNEQLMGIRREEEMEMSDDDMEDTLDSKDSEDSGTECVCVITVWTCQSEGFMLSWGWVTESVTIFRWTDSQGVWMNGSACLTRICWMEKH